MGGPCLAGDRASLPQTERSGLTSGHRRVAGTHTRTTPTCRRSGRAGQRPGPDSVSRPKGAREGLSGQVPAFLVGRWRRPLPVPPPASLTPSPSLVPPAVPAPPLLRRDRWPPCQLLSLTTSTSTPSLQAPGVPRPTSRSKSVPFNTPPMDQVRGLSHQSRDLRGPLLGEGAPGLHPRSRSGWASWQTPWSTWSGPSTSCVPSLSCREKRAAL